MPISGPGSAIVHDMKGENWHLTAGFRARHGRVLLFDPTNAKSAAYNPLLEVRRGEWEVRDVQNIADILVEPEGSLEKRNHGEKNSHALLVGANLHVLYAETDTTSGRASCRERVCKYESISVVVVPVKKNTTRRNEN